MNIYASVVAQNIAEALARDSWEDAFALLSEFTGDELQEVAALAIEKGADPTAVQSLVDARQSEEVIEVVGTAPRKRAFWAGVRLGALIAGGVMLGAVARHYHKRV